MNGAVVPKLLSDNPPYWHSIRMRKPEDDGSSNSSM